MSRISKLERSEVLPEMAALYDKIFAQRGNVPNMFRTMAHRPEIFSTMMAHFASVLNTGTVSSRLKELIIVRTSQLNVTPTASRHTPSSPAASAGATINWTTYQPGKPVKTLLLRRKPLFVWLKVSPSTPTASRTNNSPN
jgi:hypothetical protein